MITLFYRKMRVLILTIALIGVWGISSYIALPRLEDPELVSRFATIQTFWSGADAERVEALITEKIEERLVEIEEVKEYKSTSSNGSSILVVELQDTVSKEQVDGIWSRVQNKLDEVKPELPAGSNEPELDQGKVKAFALITSLTWQESSTPNLGVLNRQAKILQDQLENLAGTEEVELFGDRQEEILVEVKPEAIGSYRLSVSNIARQIEQSDAKVAAGTLSNDNSDLALEVAGELDTLKQVKNIPLNFGNNSQFIRLQDIAQVSKGVKMPANEETLISGRPGVTVAVHIDSATRLDLWATRAKSLLATFAAELPREVALNTIFDQSQYVTARLNGLILNLIVGGSLVFLVTLVMMGWRSALIIGSSLPLSILMVFGWMNVMGIPLHQMSITGLIVALGILIDNAIVVVDEVNNHLRRGFKGKDAIKNSINHLAVPLLSSTITTILAFLPIALLPGSTGEFVGTIGLSVILAVSSSMFLSLTVIPSLTAKFSGERKAEQHLSWWQRGISLPRLTQWFAQSLTWITTKPWLGITLALWLPLFGLMQAGSLEQQFFPPADRDQLQIQVELPATTAIEQTKLLAQEIRERILTNNQITDVHWFIGRSAPRFYYNVGGSRERESNYAQAIVQLKDLATSELIQQLQRDLDRAFPRARVLVRQLEQGPPFDAPIELRISGTDIELLQRLGEQARSLLRNLEEVTHARASLDEIRPQLTFEVDEEQARLAGLDHRAIAEQLDQSLAGNMGGTILESTEELPIRVRLAPRNRSQIRDLAALDLLSTNSNQNNLVNRVPLSALGKISLTPELAKITHYNGQRVNTIQGFLQAGVLPDTVLQKFKQQLASNPWQLPQGYSYQFGGEAEQKDNALGGLFSVIGVLVVLMIATLVMSLGSFRLAIIIGVVAVAAIGLGLFAIWLFGYPFGFNPIIGTVGLIGVAINDSIVVIAAIQKHPSAKSGDLQAIQQVVLNSTRHVVATTITTAVGFVPLLLGGGEFWPPLAVAIAGGVIGATLLALYFVPAAYILVSRSTQIQKRLRVG
ncbi:MAG: efflux RND transporter permease subunit [Cyanobacteria bacterium P01_A01_bin.40]